MSKELVVDQAVNTLHRGLPFVQNGMQHTLDTAVSLLECDAEETDRVKSLKDMMLSFCSIQRDVKQIETAAKHVMTQAKSTRDPIDLEDMFEQKLAELQRVNTTDGLKENEKYVELLEHIQNAVESAGGADETEVIGSREIQLDDDLAMTQTEVNTKCPVTMKEMIKPVRNKHCGHNYDYSGAKQLIRNRQQARCPVAGCINDKPLKLCDLEENKELKRIIDRQHWKASKTSSKS